MPRDPLAKHAGISGDHDQKRGGDGGHGRAMLQLHPAHHVGRDERQSPGGKDPHRPQRAKRDDRGEHDDEQVQAAYRQAEPHSAPPDGLPRPEPPREPDAHEEHRDQDGSGDDEASQVSTD